jgi:hypothetical protein
MGVELRALRLQGLAEGALPSPADWEKTDSVRFDKDWQGKNQDAERSTEVRALWTPQTLFLRFVCRYRELVVFTDADPNGRRDGLWDRDVAEAFLQPDRFGSRYYSEIEVSPNGMWVDLDIFPGGRRPLKSGMRCTAEVSDGHVWMAQVAIPIIAITRNFDPAQPWRANFYRCEGQDPNRWYSAWQATNTPEPAYHVPESFGVLRFE